MIDFRYHVVSLVSVFLALAVGIVLGAGPLKEQIGNTLSDQVTSLAREKAGLRSDLDAADSAVAHRDQFITTITPAMAAEQLQGRSVVLVRLPGVDNASVDAMTGALRAAGASLSGEVDVHDTWTAGDPNVLNPLTAELQDSLPGGSSLTGTSDEVLAALLARAVVAPEPAAAASGRAAGQAVLDGLKRADLIGTKGDLSTRATEAILLAPPVEVASGGTPSSPTDAVRRATTASLDIADALDTGSAGSVVVGPASAAGDGGLISAVRDDDNVSQRVSTVDTGDTSMGPLTAVLALREQLRGASGSYGFADGAKQPLPTLVQAGQS
jgi:hypothetical protein